MLQPKITTFSFFNVNGSLQEEWSEAGFFKRGWDCCCGLSCRVCCQDLVEVDVASDNDYSVAGVTAAAVVVVALADVVFDDDYIVCVAADVVVAAGYVFLFVIVAVDDAGVPAVAHVNA